MKGRKRKTAETQTKYREGRERRSKGGGETQDGKKNGDYIHHSQTSVMPVFLEQILWKMERLLMKCNRRDKENMMITLLPVTQ